MEDLWREKQRGERERESGKPLLSHILIIDSSWVCREINWVLHSFSKLLFLYSKKGPILISLSVSKSWKELDL